MSERPLLLAVAEDDALDDVLARLRDAAGRSVLLAIPDNSALFLTASEFRAIKEVADRGRVAVSLRTGDPLRLQLARLLGVDAAPPPAPAPPAPPPPPTPAPNHPSATPAPGVAHHQPSRPVPPTPHATGSPPDVANARPAAGSPPSTPPVPVSLPPAPTATVGSTAAAAVQPAAKPTPKANGAAAPLPTSDPAETPVRPPTSTPATPASPAEPVVDTASTAADAPWPDPPPPRPPAPRRSPIGRPNLGAARRAVAGSLARRHRLPPTTRSGVPEPASPTVAEQAVAATAGVATTERPSGEMADRVPAIPADQTSGTPPPTDRSAAIRTAWHQHVERVRDSPRALATVIGLVLALLIAVSGIVVFVLPEAVVTLVVAQRPLVAELLVDVVAGGAEPPRSADLMITAEPVSLVVPFENSIPTSGVRLEPDEAATGTIRFRNPEPEAASVAAGTILATEAGVEYEVVADVSVPAAEGDKPGDATGEIRAVEPGSSGNSQTPGVVGGRLPNGVYFSSRDGPLSGGTDRRTSIVAEDDLATLRREAAATAPDLAAEALSSRRGGTMALLTESVEIGEPTERFDHAPGDAAEKVSLRAEVPVSGLAYDPSALQAAATNIVAARLADDAPAGFAVDRASIQLIDPEVIERQDGVTRLRFAVAAQARAELSDAERNELAERLAGTDPSDADAILSEIPDVTGHRVTYRPRWLPDRMPSNAGRIEIVTVSTNPGTKALATPEATL